jgi:dipeptidyl aminopeptidase/acylaminoacyl peptidase
VSGIAGFCDFDRIGTFSLHPAGTRVAYTCDAGGRPGLWQVAAGGGEPAPLWHGPPSPELCAWRPDGRAVLINADPDGSENYQLGEVDAGSGTVTWLTAAPGVRHEVAASYGSGTMPYSPDSARLAFSSNARDRSVFDVIVRDLRTGAEHTVLTGDDRYFPMSWSPDGSVLLVLRLHQNTEQDLFACVPGTGEVRLVTPHEGLAAYYPVAWSGDGSGCYVVTSQGRDFAGLAFLGLAGPRQGTLSWIAAPGHDIDGAAVSGDEQRIVWAANLEGYSELHVLDRRTGAERVVEGLPAGALAQQQGYEGACLALTPDGRTLLCLLSTATAPTELYAIGLEHGTGRPLTRNGARTSAAVTGPGVVKIPSADGVTVPAMLYRPPGASAARPVPVLMSIHGGPEAQERPEWAWTNSLYQFLLANGVGVLAPNARGSTGYGLAYQRMIYRDWGHGDVRDFAACAAYLRDLDWADSARLGVFGASYGGFAALSCLARMPGTWRAGVDLFGPSDLAESARSMPPYWQRRIREWIGDPAGDERMLRDGSPLTHIDRIEVPLLVVQGTNDARVGQEESDAVVARLRALGRPVEYVVLPGEGHGFAERETFTRVWGLAADWLLAHLAGQPAGQPS